ncbi:hypothetical protein [Pelagibacterium xiamenense]|uniref:hypothetical protein n=1 Tax=Pelagibacterium xiamenense TaxID=2901140 RepID=UPI001E479F31|nr:hypothetical protein [Pelagibacterium xiamenense]MCD7059671.1 hypothetical protein [Pelagibacterium xiamenense]
MSSPAFRFVLLSGFSLVLIVSGSFLAWREVTPYQWGAAPRAGIFSHLRAEEVGLPPSLDGMQVVMESCLTATTSVHGLIQPDPDRETVLTRCATLADAAVAAMPTYSFGWYAGAYFGLALGQAEAGSAWLIRSREAAPSAQWIAEVRVALAEDYFALLTEAAQESHRADLALLAMSQRGVNAIASRYVSDPDFRERITSVVETLEPDVQRRFLARVRAAMGQ